ncbi:MAG: VOC family protein [Phenylobacterium sp.]
MWASRDFYAAVLGFMGYRQVAEDVRGFDFDLAAGEGFCSIGIMKAEGPGAGRAHDRYSPGLHHVAWTAESRQDVDLLHELLVTIGAQVLDPPADYPRYGAGYYAVFFADPDGLKLEYVHKPRG